MNVEDRSDPRRESQPVLNPRHPAIYFIWLALLTLGSGLSLLSGSERQIVVNLGNGEVDGVPIGWPGYAVQCLGVPGLCFLWWSVLRSREKDWDAFLLLSLAVCSLATGFRLAGEVFSNVLAERPVDRIQVGLMLMLLAATALSLQGVRAKRQASGPHG